MLMLMRQIVESELLEFTPVEEITRRYYLSGNWPKLFQPNTVEELLALKKAGELPPDLFSALPFRLSPKAPIFKADYEVDITKTLRYNAGCTHSHVYYEMLYLSRGSCTQVINGKDLSIQEGDLVILAPDSSHNYQILDDSTISLNLSIGKETFEHLFYHLFDENSVMYDFFSQTLNNRNSAPYLIFRTGQDSMIQELLYEMYYERTHPIAYTGQMLNIRMSELFIYLMRYHQEHLVFESDGLLCSDAVLPMLQYIQFHYADVTLSDLSNQFHYKESYISFLLKKNTGKSFSEIRHEMRMHRSAELLKKTEKPIKDIAIELGFSDQSHFTRLFREKYELTPKKYREIYTTRSNT